MHSRCVAVSLFAILMVIGVPAAAEDAPYAPQHYYLDELIVFEQFDDPPLAFPWDVVEEYYVSDGDRRDFELVYDVEYDTVREVLSEAYREAEDVVALEPHAMKYTDVDALRLMGLQLGPDSGRITVGHPEVQANFIVDIAPDGNRTSIIIMNYTRARHFSGFVPARSDFQPLGASPIPFRWN